MDKPCISADDRMTLMLGSFGILCQMPKPQCYAEIPYYSNMSPGLKYLTVEMLERQGMVISGSTMFNPTLTRWQKIRRFCGRTINAARNCSVKDISK